MAWPVRHMGDLRAVRLPVGPRPQLIEQSADRLHDLEIVLFAVATDVVGLADTPGFEHAADCAAVVPHVEPVPHLQTVPKKWKRLTGQCVLDGQRD